MIAAPPKLGRLEELLAGLLRYGTWLASAAIGLGLALALIDSNWNALGMRVATVGIVLLILLPTMRVLVMLFVFAKDRDFRHAIAAMVVLSIILAGVVLGLRKAGAIER